jgi:hypothetical protein
MAQITSFSSSSGVQKFRTPRAVGNAEKYQKNIDGSV